MKRLILILQLIISVAACWAAADFDSLWKEAHKNEGSHPRKSIAVLDDIAKKALREHEYGELLAAQLMRARIMGDISPDSITPAIDRLKNDAARYEKKQPVVAAVAYAVIGSINNDSAYFDKALAHPELLAQEKTKAYRRLLTDGDDTLWNDDLLSIIGHEARRYRWLADWYDVHGNRRAACIEHHYASSAMSSANDDEWLSNKRTYLTSAIERYADLPEAAILAYDLYEVMLDDEDISRESLYDYLRSSVERWGSAKTTNALRNAMARITNPAFELSVDGERNVLPNKPFVAHINRLRNVESLTLNIYRLDCDGRMNLSLYNSNDRKRIMQMKSKGVSPVSITHQFDVSRPWDETSDSITVNSLSPGVYLVEASSPQTETAYELLYVSDITVLWISSDKKNHRLVTVSSTTGQPLPSTSILLRRSARSNVVSLGKDNITLTTDAKGEAKLNSDFVPDIIYASRNNDQGFREMGFNTYFYKHSYTEKRDIVTLLTDRSIYKPGQKVCGTAIVHNAANTDSIRVVEGKRIVVTAYDSESKIIEKDTLVTDSFGNASFAFTIPEGRRNGRFMISASGKDLATSSVSFNVAEYKRPAFEIIPDTIHYPDNMKAFIAGDTVNVGFKAVTFSNIRVGKAKVKYSVTRMPSWYWRSGRSFARRVFVKDREATTDSQGHVSIPVPLILPEKVHTDFQYVVDVMITDPNGETQESSVRINVRPDSVDPQPEVKEPRPEEREAYFKVSGDTVFVGSCLKDVYAVYSVRSEEKVIDSGAWRFSSEIISHIYKYKKEYGSGLTVSVAWVKNGKVNMFSQTIAAPKPDLSLSPKWHTFRDRTHPGSTERWRMHIDKGTAPYVLTASVFDRSLDKIAPHSWMMNVVRNYSSMNYHWQSAVCPSIYLSANHNAKFIEEYSINFSQFDHSLFPFRHMMLTEMKRPMRLYAMSARVESAQMVEEAMMVKKDMSNDNATDMKVGMNEEKKEELSGLRTDLAESAVFIPSVVSDKNGNIDIEFTLPETMTTWRFLSLIHDRSMRNVIVDTVTVAQKSVIVRPSVPRFLRHGDKVRLSSVITNNTKSECWADVTIRVLDADEQRCLAEEASQVVIKAGEDAKVGMIFDSSVLSTDAVVIVYAKASDGSTDGEKHVIHHVPNTETIVRTEAITQHQPGVRTVDVNNMIYRNAKDVKMSVSYVENAALLMLDAIEEMKRPASADVFSVASSLYVNLMAGKIKNNEMANDSIVHSCENRLRDMQLSDGSWSWCTGMDPSPYVTASIVRMLARLKNAGAGTASTESLLNKCLPYISALIKKDADRIREEQKKHPKRQVSMSWVTTDLLYSLSLIDAVSSSVSSNDRSLLLRLMSRDSKETDLYNMSHAAVVLGMNGKKKEAKQLLQTLIEYSVVTDEAGRYFDSPRAPYSWRNYRIPTVVSAIEAINMLSPEELQKKSEFQRWLLHEKRTQQWDTSLNSVDAIHAFTLGKEDAFKETDNDALLCFNGNTISTNDTIEVNADIQNSLTMEKNSEGTSWGAVFVRQEVPVADIMPSGTGFSIHREIIGGKNVGDKVRVRLTVKANRDYDLVSIVDKRPANLRPEHQTSGYRYGYYEEVKEQETRYYVNHVAKGTHVYETTYFIDHEGDFTSGTASVTCTYAPEFTAIEK